MAEGVGYGLKEFGQGLFKGLSGVVLQPIKGAKKEGLKGFGKGLGKGLLGFVTYYYYLISMNVITIFLVSS